VTLENLDGAPYLPRPAVERAGGIGLVWRGNPRHANDANRSLSSADLLAEVPGGVFLEARGDLLDSAGRLAALDALITVDTSWAHLAGAMGLPCAVLLPHANTDWRWGLGETTPWYASLRLFRQPAPGDWAGAITAATAWTASLR
jgi:ADP-heptose:LPS heptosyltransferase